MLRTRWQKQGSHACRKQSDTISHAHVHTKLIQHTTTCKKHMQYGYEYRHDIKQIVHIYIYIYIKISITSTFQQKEGNPSLNRGRSSLSLFPLCSFPSLAPPGQPVRRRRPETQRDRRPGDVRRIPGGLRRMCSRPGGARCSDRRRDAAARERVPWVPSVHRVGD